MTMRDRFEEYLKLNDICYARHPSYPEQYQIFDTQLRWLGFQAGASCRPSREEVARAIESATPDNYFAHDLAEKQADAVLALWGGGE